LVAEVTGGQPVGHIDATTIARGDDGSTLLLAMADGAAATVSVDAMTGADHQEDARTAITGRID
jgi:hypothetical protein